MVSIFASPSVTMEPAVVKVGDKITVTIESDGWILKGGPIVKGPAEGSLTSTGGTLTATGQGYVIVSTYWVHPNGNDGEEEMSATGTTTVVTVEITKCPDRMLVEGKFIVKAEAKPDISDARYTWFFNGRNKDFDPNPTGTKTTQFNPKKVTSGAVKSFITVKYSVVEDQKEEKVTRCEYFKKLRDLLGPGVIQRDGGNYYTCESNTCSRFDEENIVHYAFYALFQYELYDQYREFLGESEQGGSIPYVKETHTEKPYSVFLNELNFTDDWTAIDDCKMGSGQNDQEEGDEVSFPFQFRLLASENLVRNFDVANHVHLDWLASVQEGKHEQETVEHELTSYFLDVVREKRNNKLISFKLKTSYIRVGHFIK